jgi:hypothetical protein
VETGCRYAVCGGATSEQWHLDLDVAFVDLVPEEQSASRFMMTTSHAGEAPYQVAWYFAWNTNFDGHNFDRFLVIVLGPVGEAETIENAVIRAVTDPDAGRSNA